MTSIAQRQELQAKIWRIANDVRGSVDGWDFKQFVLGALFYRFISENFTLYIEAGDESIDYSKLTDDVITPEIKDDAIKTKGYFIYPSQLFKNVAKAANTNPNLNTDLKTIFDAIESSANGYPSEPDIKGLFADFDTTSTRLGNTVEGKNSRLAAVLKGVEELNFGNFEDNQIDLFGDAYEFLISNYAANAGKSGGEFFTPQHVSKLIAQLAMHKQDKVNKIYDPAAGSGSLLLQAKKHFDNHIIEEGFYARMRPSNKSKIIRFQPFAAAAEAGLVDYVEGPWNDDYFDELELFDGSRKNKDDQVDATSDAFITLAQRFQIPNFTAALQESNSQFKTHNPFT